MTSGAGESLRDIALRFFGEGIPHLEELGIGLVERHARGLTLRLPHRETLIGHPENGLLHGGAVMTLVDTACGFATMLDFPEPQPVATLDLRLDYLRPAEAGRDLFARAECIQRTRQVAFARATAYQESPERPVAVAAGTFVVIEGSLRPPGTEGASG